MPGLCAEARISPGFPETRLVEYRLLDNPTPRPSRADLVLTAAVIAFMIGTAGLVIYTELWPGMRWGVDPAIRDRRTLGPPP